MEDRTPSADAAMRSAFDRTRLSVHRDATVSGTVMMENTTQRFNIFAPLYHGSIKLESEGRVIQDGAVRPGMVRLDCPGDRTLLTRRCPRKFLTLSMPAHEFRNVIDQRGARAISRAGNFIQPILDADYRVERLCGLVMSVAELDISQRQLFIDGLTHSLLAVLLSATETLPRRERESCVGLSKSQFNVCVEYAHSRLTERLDLQSWAGSLGMTPHEFARRFQQTTQMAPYAWYMALRIDHAKEMLLRGRLPTAEIALEVGFCSQSHFTEAFRRRVGMSPAKWRSQFRTGGS